MIVSTMAIVRVTRITERFSPQLAHLPQTQRDLSTTGKPKKNAIKMLVSVDRYVTAYDHRSIR